MTHVPLPSEKFNQILAQATAEKLRELRLQLIAASPDDRAPIFDEIQSKVALVESLGFRVNLVPELPPRA